MLGALASALANHDGGSWLYSLQTHRSYTAARTTRQRSCSLSIFMGGQSARAIVVPKLRFRKWPFSGRHARIGSDSRPTKTLAYCRLRLRPSGVLPANIAWPNIGSV